MKTSKPFSFAALKMRSMFSTGLFSLMLSPTDLAVALLAAIFLGAFGLGLFLRRIDMSL